LSMISVFRANSFAAPIVKLQAERGHSIADTGPYAYVRHPMYAGAIPFLIGMPLLLDSWYGLIGSAVTVVALGFRAVGEERLLTRELDGYPEYAARVRYRLVPSLW
jgi:protein-S-isoprenylcysteine O-methyltransferase Ste14